MQLPYNPPVVCLGIHPEIMKTCIHTKTFTWIIQDLILLVLKRRVFKLYYHGLWRPGMLRFMGSQRVGHD